MKYLILYILFIARKNYFIQIKEAKFQSGVKRK